MNTTKTKGVKKVVPIIIVGDSQYDMTPAYIEGALAFRKSISWKSNPYREGSANHQSWEYGHVHESAGEHIRFGLDTLQSQLDLWKEDPLVPRDPDGGVNRAWYAKSLDFLNNLHSLSTREAERARLMLELDAKLLKSQDPLQLVFEWVKTGHIDKSVFKALIEGIQSRECDPARVLEWMHSDDRKPANLAFTAGPERQAAYWIEIGQAALPARRSMKP